MDVQRICIGNRRQVDQGDILRDVEMMEYSAESGGILEVGVIVFPLAVILSQSCDLQGDSAARWGRPPASPRKAMLGYLVAPLYSAEQLLEGSHLTSLGFPKQQDINPKAIRDNNDPRYHYLAFGPEVPIADMVVDFKHHFTANPKTLKTAKKEQFVCRLAVPHREQLNQRFASWLGRVGLP